MGKIKIVGGENIPAEGQPCIFVSNHDSYVDPAVIWRATERPARFWMKTDILFKYVVDPVLVRILRIFFGVILVDRRKRNTNPIPQSVPLLRKGECIAVFPAGTRKIKKLSYKGVVQLAIETNVPVVPLFLKGTHGAANVLDFARRGRIPVTVLVGKPMVFSRNGLPPKIQREEGLRRISETIETLGALV